MLLLDAPWALQSRLLRHLQICEASLGPSGVGADAAAMSGLQTLFPCAGGYAVLAADPDKGWQDAVRHPGAPEQRPWGGVLRAKARLSWQQCELGEAVLPGRTALH
jgi:hypothetical protein